MFPPQYNKKCTFDGIVPSRVHENTRFHLDVSLIGAHNARRTGRHFLLPARERSHGTLFHGAACSRWPALSVPEQSPRSPSKPLMDGTISPKNALVNREKAGKTFGKPFHRASAVPLPFQRRFFLLKGFPLRGRLSPAGRDVGKADRERGGRTSHICAAMAARV